MLAELHQFNMGSPTPTQVNIDIDQGACRAHRSAVSRPILVACGLLRDNYPVSNLGQVAQLVAYSENK